MIIKTKTGAHVNLSELIEFNKDLVRFKQALSGYLEGIDQAVKTLENGWQDQKIEEYKSEFKKYTELLKPLGEELESYAKFSEQHWIPLIKKHLDMKRK